MPTRISRWSWIAQTVKELAWVSMIMSPIQLTTTSYAIHFCLPKYLGANSIITDQGNAQPGKGGTTRRSLCVILSVHSFAASLRSLNLVS